MFIMLTIPVTRVCVITVGAACRSARESPGCPATGLSVQEMRRAADPLRGHARTVPAGGSGSASGTTYGAVSVTVIGH
jgi:hypothetical protein